MRVFSLIASVIAFVVTLVYLIADFPDISSFSGVIYFTLLVLLLIICLTDIISNFSAFANKLRKFKVHYK